MESLVHADAHDMTGDSGHSSLGHASLRKANHLTLSEGKRTRMQACAGYVEHSLQLAMLMLHTIYPSVLFSDLQCTCPK